MHGRFRLTVLKAAASGAEMGAERGGAERGADEGSSTLASSTERSMFHPRSALTTPRATTRSHLVTMAFHESLDVAERDALLDMVRWLHAIVQSAAGSVTETQLYRAASLVADMRVTQVVNVKKGIHLRFPKAVLEGFVAGTSYETRYPNRSNNPNEAEDEAVGCEGLGFGSEGLDAEKLLAEIDAEKARVEKEIASVGAEIDEIARLLATAELGLTAAMEQEENSEMRRSRDRTREGADGDGADSSGGAKVNDDEHENDCGETRDEETVLKYFAEKGRKFVDMNADLVTQLADIERRVYEEAVAFMEDEATEEEKEEAEEWLAARRGEREDEGSNPAGGETDEDEEVVFAQGREAKERDEEKRKE